MLHLNFKVPGNFIFYFLKWLLICTYNPTHYCLSTFTVLYGETLLEVENSKSKTDGIAITLQIGDNYCFTLCIDYTKLLLNVTNGK